MEEITTFHYILLVVGGLFAGCMNTLAGYGSVITLTLLMDVIGLPANLANGSNRINVFATSLVSTSVFYRHGKLNISGSSRYIISAFIGAMAGVYVATIVSNESFKEVFKYLLIILFGLLLVKPHRWLRKESLPIRPSSWVVIPSFLFIGFYGGFIQMGVGIPVLAVLVLVAGYNLIEANAVKVAIIGIYTLVVIMIFWSNDLIHWEAGIILAVGAYTGSWITSTFLSRHKKATEIAYWLLVLVIVNIILYQFNFWTWMGELLFS